MKIPNYDKAAESNNFTQLYPFMPSNTFRMLICGPSGCGKTNTLMHMLINFSTMTLLVFQKSPTT